MKADYNKYSVIRDLGFSLLAEGKVLKIKADGYSMYPSIRPGSVIFIEPLGEESGPAPGEIIAWKRESGFVVHRLIRILRDGNEIRYFTRGDSCGYEDQPVTREQISGKVVRVENRKNKLTDGSYLFRKPCYFINRLTVWLIIKTKRILKIILK